MSLGEKSNKIYLKASYGAIRRTSTKDDPQAKVRQNKDGENIYERVYNFVDGVLEDVTFYEHEDFGNSWTIYLTDGEEHYAIQVQEASRYGMDFLKKLPNLVKGERYKFIAYDFEKSGQRRVGISVEEMKTADKIKSYYQDIQKDGDKFIVKNLHDFPEFDGNWKDKDDCKIYFTRLAKFLRTRSLAFINSWRTEEKIKSVIDEDSEIPF
jgi:hypothetical protein